MTQLRVLFYRFKIFLVFVELSPVLSGLLFVSDMKNRKEKEMKMKLKWTSLILVVVLLMSTMTAFAGTMEDLKKDPDHIQVSGVVSDIRENKEGWTVSIDNDDMGMVFHIKENLPVYEGNSGKELSVKDIAVGTSITAVVDAMAPMTMSIPPQTAGAVAFIVESGTPETLMTTGQEADKYVPLRDGLPIQNRLRLPKTIRFCWSPSGARSLPIPI